MQLFGKRSPRQKEIRRSKAERSPAWYRRLSAGLPLRALGMLLLCAAFAAVVVNLSNDDLDLTVGQRVSRAITSRVDFRLIDEARTEVMRTRARDNAETYYVLDTSLVQDINNRLTNALRIAREHISEPEKLQEQVGKIQIAFDEEGLTEIIRLASLPDSTLYQRAVERAVATLALQPLVGADVLAQRRTSENAVLVNPEKSTERQVPILRLLFANDREDVVSVAEAVAGEFPTPLRSSMTASVIQMLHEQSGDAFKPLYRYDPARSAQAAQLAEAAVEPEYDEYAVGTRLVDVGATTRDELALLAHERAAYHAWADRNPDARNGARLAAIARGLLCFLIVAGLGGYVILHYDSFLGSTQRRLATAVTLLLILGLARATYIHGPSVYAAVGLQALAVALLTLTAVRGAAYVTTGLLAILIALATRQSVGFIIVLLAVSLVMLFGLRDVRNRGRIITVGFAATLLAIVATLLTGLVQGQTTLFVLRNWALWAGVTTLAAAFIVEGVLPTIEQIFGVSTSMTLLEWCDPNKPLLRMMAAECPGTYNHSLLVGTLADAAADAIGANGLLARTGAYYHDIGKINKPGYFVENQGLDVGNRHERLSPAMSHLIIIGHVKDGIEMAKEYSLPARLRPFIPEHHGTCVVEYFYHAASQARKPGDPEISDTEFRYPGPKPQSRETAIVMLCDAVEGAVRAMPEPTPNRIEDTVDRIIEKRLIDGQFDECDLTFRELSIIDKSLVKSLNSIYHGRITYPSDEKKPAVPVAPAAEARSAS